MTWTLFRGGNVIAPSGRRSKGQRLLHSLVRQTFHRIARGQNTVLEVVLADGSKYRNHSGEPEVRIVFKTVGSEWRFLVLGYVGFFEAYFDGKVDILGERAVATLMRMAYRSTYRYATNPLIMAMRRYLEWRDDNRDAGRAQANARRHYGLPHAFFELILGKDCLYAEGYWAGGDEGLAEAERQRCEYICRKLRLRPGDRLVEVGSGWGYMAVHAAENFGADVVNYGLVPEQNHVMQGLIDARNLSGKVRIVERDHRALLNEPQAYDRYVSVGVYEHAGKNHQQSWIESIAAALKPGGIGLISTTAYMKDVPTEYLTIKYIFPGGRVPSLPRTLEWLEASGLHVTDVEELGAHYQRAAEMWLANFNALWMQIQAIDPKLFTEHFRRVWTYFLSGVVENFRSDLNLYHITFTKGRSGGGVRTSPIAHKWTEPRKRSSRTFRARPKHGGQDEQGN
jgi:cyclopropane-fatty-acyl-phospholipid synthase